MSHPTSRAEQLAANLEQVRERISRACAAAGRGTDEVVLVAVTKTWPATDAALLRDLGITDLAENRDQEARVKAAAVTGVRWHFVGAVQTNKAKSVTSYADVVHSVDRPALVAALSAGAVRAGRVVDVLLQVSLDGDPKRGGVPAPDLSRLADLAAAAEGLRLSGLMAVAPLGVDPALAYGELARLAARLRTEHPGAGMLSAGMSGDLEQAVAAGATHLRVGTALLGHRPATLR